MTDSSADLPSPEGLPIEVVPHRIRFDDGTFTEGVDLSPTELLDRLEQASRLPEIVAPTAGGFEAAYRQLLDRDHTGVVAICTSSSLSATYEAAVIAAERAELPVRVVDSRTASMALGLPVLHAADLAADGAGLDEVAGEALRACEGSNLLLAVDTLDQLRRNRLIGRIGAQLGTWLDIKPLITFADGAAVSAGRVRGRIGAVAALAGKIGDLGPRVRRVAVLHTAGDPPDDLLDAVRDSAPWLDPTVSTLGAVFTTQTGRGALGVAYQLR